MDELKAQRLRFFNGFAVEEALATAAATATGCGVSVTPGGYTRLLSFDAFEVFDRPNGQIRRTGIVHRDALLLSPEVRSRGEIGAPLSVRLDKQAPPARKLGLRPGGLPARIPREDNVRAVLAPVHVVIVPPHVVVLALQEVFAVVD